MREKRSTYPKRERDGDGKKAKGHRKKRGKKEDYWERPPESMWGGLKTDRKIGKPQKSQYPRERGTKKEQS